MENAEDTLTSDPPVSVDIVEQDQPVSDEVHNKNVYSENDTHEDGTSVILVECNLCRICGEETKELIYVFDEQGIVLNLAQKIRWHLPIMVHENDTLPTSVCYLCVSRLESCHELANLSLDTEERLTRFFNTASGSVEVWREIDPSISTQDKNTLQVQARRPVFPFEKLIHAMSLLRQEKEKERNRMVVDNLCEVSEASKIIYENVSYPVENQEYEVAAPLEVETEPAEQWTTDFGAKENSEMEPEANTKTVVPDTCLALSEFYSHQHGGKSTDTDKRNSSHATVCDNEPSTSLILDQGIHSDSRVLSDNPSYISKLADKSTSQVEECKFICEICGKVCRVRRTLNDHIAAHHSSNAPHKCDKCERTFTTIAGWSLHKATTHSSEEPYLCDTCGKTFKHASHLQSHKRSHLSTEQKHRKICPQCGKGFRSQYHLGEHLNVHTGWRPYKCGTCPKTFHKSTQLRQHSTTHLSEKPFQCPICSRGFNRQGNMKDHLKRHYTSITCKICNQQFEVSREFQEHSKTHTLDELEKAEAEEKSNGEKQFQCSECHKAFAKRKYLIQHLASHTKDNACTCELCGKSLSKRTTMAYHIRAMHTGERPHACSVCGKTFLRAQSREVHERIHTGTKPFECSFCGAKFRSNSSLSQHMKIHTKNKDIQCSVCGKSFLRNGALKVHMRTHTGDRPFVCELCGRAFTQKNDMLKHMRKHATDKPHVFTRCRESFALKRELTRHQVAGTCKPRNTRTADRVTIDARVEEEEPIQSFVLDKMHSLATLLP